MAACGVLVTPSSWFIAGALMLRPHVVERELESSGVSSYKDTCPIK